MTIEEVIKNTKQLSNSKKTILNILFTEKIASESLTDILKPYDLSIEQYNVLRILRGQNNKPINMSAIQDRMLAKKSNTTRLVHKLLIKNLVTKKVCSNNRRIIEVVITAQGLSLLKIVDPIIEQKENSFTNNFNNDELNMLNSLLEKYRNNING